MVDICAINGCPSTFTTPNVLFHRLPPKPEIQALWRRVTGATSDRDKICSRHFQSGDYSSVGILGKQKRLKKSAWPTMNLPEGGEGLKSLEFPSRIPIPKTEAQAPLNSEAQRFLGYAAMNTDPTPVSEGVKMEGGVHATQSFQAQENLGSYHIIEVESVPARLPVPQSAASSVMGHVPQTAARVTGHVPVTPVRRAEFVPLNPASEPEYVPLNPVNNVPTRVPELHPEPTQDMPICKTEVAFKCSYCQMHQESFEKLQAHYPKKCLSQSPKNVSGQCPSCPLHVQCLYSHVNFHHNSSRLQCNLCPRRVFNDRSRLRRHWIWHIESRSFYCDICGVAYDDKEQLKEHAMQTHRATLMHLDEGEDETEPLIALQDQPAGEEDIQEEGEMERILQEIDDVPSETNDEDGIDDNIGPLSPFVDDDSSLDDPPNFKEEVTEDSFGEASRMEHRGIKMEMEAEEDEGDLEAYEEDQDQEDMGGEEEAEEEADSEMTGLYSGPKKRRKIKAVKERMYHYCKLCDKRVKHLELHMKLFHENSPLVCEKCPKRNFTSAHSLYRHMAKNCGKPTSQQCEECGKVCTTSIGLRNHVLTAHRPMEEWPYPCGQCPRRFVKKDFRDRHWNIKHSEERKYVCHLCGKGFKDQYYCQTHVARCEKGPSTNYRGRRRRGITYNTYTDPSKYTLGQTEDGKESVTCNECQKVFVTSCNLNSIKNHIETVHVPNELKEFKCTECPLAFTKKDRLEVHMYTHTNARPYICRVCGKGFNQTATQYGHERKVHGYNPPPAERKKKGRPLQAPKPEQDQSVMSNTFDNN